MHAIFQIKLTDKEAAPGGYDSRYRFRDKYLNIVRDALDDWIIYYQPAPRAGTKVIGSTGYFATARVASIHPLAGSPGYSEALLEQYLELEETVPFSIIDLHQNRLYFERNMVQSDGRMNSHIIQQQVRALSNEEYTKIERLGFSKNWIAEEQLLVVTPPYGFAEDPPESVERDRILTSRAFRDRVFSQLVVRAYNMKCAMTGISLQAPDGSFEMEGAHIKPVEDGGPDSLNNGIPLLQSIHWMFDNGLIAIGSEYQILKSSRYHEPKIDGLLNESGKITLPKNSCHFPHPEFLRYHREHIFLP
ncbi:HNH endonuclease [Phyllobacterium bourgognense]|uniref:Putative restriction endonuclease n=1 Tax=Phyllobacterium bourgognense TaxID=314236 RepID=A0A368YYF7_9HYPH|nr:HNH endonuclease [Phyllobacterium bourgognense]RCW83224.1 putative restriction endonuclease [Phyllobacterium bourgognense]